MPNPGLDNADPEVAVVVEDDPLVAMVATEMLTDLGYDVRHAVNADDAALLLGQAPVSLLFTDITMPGSMNGLQFAWAVSEISPRTQILIASGLYNLRRTDIPPGARFLGKPYTEEEVRAAIDDGHGTVMRP